MEDLPRGFQLIQACDAAIIRVRAAIHRGAGDDEAVAEDWELIRQSVQVRCVAYARLHRGRP